MNYCVFNDCIFNYNFFDSTIITKAKMFILKLPKNSEIFF